MSRRVVVLLASLAVLIALAVAPWTISSPRLKDQVVQQLRNAYGLELIASGQTTLALLPVPRLKFTGVTLAGPDGTVLVEGAQFRGELQFLPLVAARLDLTDLSIVRGTMRLQIRPDGTTSWDPVVAKAKESLAAAGGRLRLRRVVLQRTKMVIDDQRQNRTTELGGVNLVARWPARSAPFELTASAVWNGEPVVASLSGLLPTELASKRASHAEIRVASRHGEATFSGLLGLKGPRLDGQISATTASLNRFLTWSGLARALPAMGRPMQVAGAFVLSPSELSLPRMTLTSGGAQLDGAVSIHLDPDRSTVRATLAGDTLDLSPALAGSGQGWDALSVDIAALRQADLDLRLSASTLSLGGIQLHDLAAGLLTSADKVEISLGRASLNNGIVKGRLSLNCAGRGYDSKLQGSFSKIDMASLLTGFGQGGLLTGLARGQASLEADGATPAEFVRSLSGKIELSLEDGELLGVALGGNGNEAEPRRSPGPNRAGARTPFQQFALDLNVAGGHAEFADSSLESPALHASFSGQISLADRTMNVRARTGTPTADERGAMPTGMVDISGPWTNPVVTPATAVTPAQH